MTVDRPNYTPKTDLALSAAPGLLPEDCGAVAAIERELQRIEAGALPDRLIEYIWPGAEPVGRIQVSESEFRALWGDR